ncbi:hypothetical protein C4K04_2720 [Pseudomonas chlororaphis]|uniref:Uncharacterized protein n=1 Tax=Pseudomonas chlororaphis TaxID=587753 RepID=A0A3G7TPS3_9PSED|nr:hypothetical protein [Pseudomonas chlororaphis]AZE48392.1 hypothetical protein C4K04_2720 [Pseudomonas chlororaphis]
MSFENTLSAYTRLLENKPGYALEIGCDCVAVLIDGGLHGAPIEDGQVNLKKRFDFDISGWDEDNDCWESDVSAGQTGFFIHRQKYLPLCPSE